MEEFEYRLFKYEYKYHVQGTEEYAEEYALLYVPKDSTFSNSKSVLFQERYQEYYHEIDLNSVKDLTIKF